MHQMNNILPGFEDVITQSARRRFSVSRLERPDHGTVAVNGLARLVIAVYPCYTVGEKELAIESRKMTRPVRCRMCRL